MKKLLIILIISLMFVGVSAQPVEAGFFSWMGNLFSSSQVQNQNYDDNVNITIFNQTFEEHEIIEFVNENDELRDYIDIMDYSCFSINLAQKEEFSVIFNLENNTLKALSKEYSCSNDVKINKELLDKLEEEGFDGSKVNEYRKHVSLPLGVYWKLGFSFLG